VGLAIRLRADASYCVGVGVGVRVGAGLIISAVTLLLAAPAVASPQGADWTAIDHAAGCGSCHLGSPDPTDSPAIAIEGLPERAIPGKAYTLQIVVTDPALQIAGFMLAVTSAGTPSGAPASGDTATTHANVDVPAGTLANADATSETLDARARSTRAGALPPAPGAMRWTLVWTAPPALAGPIHFELWANAGNDDLSPLGDRLHHRIWQIPAGD
jgi:hypothetical protein